MRLNPISGNDPGLPSARLFEVHDFLTLALDATEHPTGYSQSDREARAYVRSALRRVDKMSETYAAAYARHTGHPVVRIAAWMAAETWLTAEEAVVVHFTDRIEAAKEPQAVAAHDYTKFRQPPEPLVRLALKNGWASASPDGNSKETENAV